MKNQTVVAQTGKGHRIFLEGVFSATGRTIGQRYDVVYNPASIHIVFSTEGKRKVVASKGGVIDLEGKRISQWAQGATSVVIDHTTAQIIIQRA